MSKKEIFKRIKEKFKAKKELALLTLLLLVIATVPDTSAFFTTKQVAHNVITSGAVVIDLQETTLNGNGEEKPYPKDPVVGVMPGREHSKIVRVKNTGEQPAWIRIRVEISVEDAAGKQLPADKVSIQYDDQYWLEEDGYYYYKTKLAAGARTQPLFREVVFDTSMGNEYQNSTVTVEVIAHGVQSANNEIPKTPAGADVTDVKGWPSLGT